MPQDTNSVLAMVPSDRNKFIQNLAFTSFVGPQIARLNGFDHFPLAALTHHMLPLRIQNPL
jgi:hypothetical protein